MRYVIPFAVAFALTATSALAASNAKIEVVDTSTLRVSAAPKAGVKFAKMRANLLRAASQETLRRGYDWFEVTDVVDLTRERHVGVMQADFPTFAGTARPLLLTGIRFTNEVRMVEPGATATVHMGKGPRPDSETSVDARAMLASLR